MRTIFRLCVLTFIISVEHTSAYEHRIHTPIGMFKYGKQIGAGSYGKVRRGVFMKSQMDVAIKIEVDDRVHDKHRSNLAIEKLCYDDMGVQLGVPQILYFGDNEHDQEKIMVMEMLGLNLDKMFIQSKLNFSLERIHWIAKQLIDRMQTVHEAGWVYVDIKPENFAVGKYDSWLIYIFDFGLSQKYLDENGKHIKPGGSARYGPGTVEFMSVWAHKTLVLSRRDDIEACGYLILYFLQGQLPWTEDLDNDDYTVTSNAVYKKKLEMDLDSIGGHAAAMGNYFKYARDLEFDEEPDYKYLREMLDDILS